MPLHICLLHYVVLSLGIGLPFFALVRRFGGIFDWNGFIDLRGELLWLLGLEIFIFPGLVDASAYCSGISAYLSPLRPFFDRYWSIPIGKTDLLIFMDSSVMLIGVAIQLTGLYLHVLSATMGEAADNMKTHNP